MLTLHCISLLIESIFARFLMLHSQNVRLHDFDSVIFSHFLHRHSTLLTLLISGDLTPPVTTDLFPLNCFLKAKPDVSKTKSWPVKSVTLESQPSPLLSCWQLRLCVQALNCQIPGIIFSLCACGSSPVHTLRAWRICVTLSLGWGQIIWPRHFLRGYKLVARERNRIVLDE